VGGGKSEHHFSFFKEQIVGNANPGKEQFFSEDKCNRKYSSPHLLFKRWGVKVKSLVNKSARSIGDNRDEVNSIWCKVKIFP